MDRTFDPLMTVTRLVEDTRLTEDDLLQSPHGVVPDLLHHFGSCGSPVALPTPASACFSLDQVLCMRTAIRFYSKEPIDAAQAAAILRAASAVDRRNWASEQTAGVSLDLLLLAWSVSGVPSGVYHYASDAHALIPVGAAPDQATAEDLVLQREFASAAALLLVVGNLAAALERHGSHGHRLLLTRAGAAAHGGWLAGISTGLVGSVFAGLLPRAVQELTGTDGYTQAPLFALSVGRPLLRDGV